MLLKDNKALEAPQKKLLKELMSLEALADYCLVGGIGEITKNVKILWW